MIDTGEMYLMTLLKFAKYKQVYLFDLKPMICQTKRHTHTHTHTHTHLDLHSERASTTHPHTQIKLCWTITYETPFKVHEIVSISNRNKYYSYPNGQ